MLHDGAFKTTPKTEQGIDSDIATKIESQNVKSDESELIENDPSKTEDVKFQINSTKSPKIENVHEFGMENIIGAVFSVLMISFAISYFVYRWKKIHA